MSQSVLPSVNRRRFLGLLFASVAAAAVPVKSLWMPVGDVALPPLTPQALCSLDAIVMEAARLLSRRVALPVVRKEDGLRIGQSGMTKQLGVDLRLPDTLTETGLDIDRYLKPSIHSIAAHIQHYKFRAFGELPLPMGVDAAYRATSGRDGVSVRGLLFYDALRDESHLRLDVIGAAA
jgi:hypothetical protein